MLAGLVMAAVVAFAPSSVAASLILSYDSHTDSQSALSVVGVTDSSLVSSAGANNTFGNKAIMAAIHGSQSNVQGASGNQNDMQFRFGSSRPGRRS
jgi:hypothetical protein